MDENLDIIEPIFSAAFGRVIAKTMLVSLATSAGTLIAMGAVGYGYTKVQEMIAAKKKSNTPATVTVTPTE